MFNSQCVYKNGSTEKHKSAILIYSLISIDSFLSTINEKPELHTVLNIKTEQHGWMITEWWTGRRHIA